MSSCDEGEQFEVEAIIAHKIRSNGRKTYRIRWKGYPPEEDTWEKQANLDCQDLLNAYWDTVKAKEKEQKKRNLSKISIKKQNKRRRNASPEANVPTVNMEGVFDKAPSTPPPIDDEEVAGPPPKKKLKLNEKEKSPPKKKHKKKSKRERSKSRDPDEPSTSSSKSKKKDKKKKKDKHRDRDGEGSSKSSSKKSHNKEKEASDTTKSKEKTACTSPEDNGARVPPLIIIMSEGSSVQNKDKSASSDDNENADQVVMKTEPTSRDDQRNENTETEASPLSNCSSSPIGEEAPVVLDNQISPSATVSNRTFSENILSPNIPENLNILKSEESELSDGFPPPRIAFNIDTPNIPRESSVNQIVEAYVEITEIAQNVQRSESNSDSSEQVNNSEAIPTNSSIINERPSSMYIVCNDAVNVVPEQPCNVSTNAELNDIPSSTRDMHPFTPEFVQQLESPATQPPIRSPVAPVLPLSSHKCFENSPSIYEFAKNATVHNINHHQIMYVLSKIWKVRCPDCTARYVVNNDSIEYAFALLEYKTKNYFLIKIRNCLNELFLMEAESFKRACPRKYANFVSDTREYFEALGDLGMAIDEQKHIVASHYKNNGILHHFNSDPQATFRNTPISYESEKVRQATRDIVKLFTLELNFALGQFMAKHLDFFDLENFAMQFYNQRDPMYTVVEKEYVEQHYEALYLGLIQKPSNS